MLKTRTFRVCVVDPENPHAYDPDGNGAMNVVYDGSPDRIGL
jgi:hypothetical protein